MPPRAAKVRTTKPRAASAPSAPMADAPQASLLPADAADRITQLPTPILHSILSLLPLREACRTAVLSRRWRFLFASLPRLHIDAAFALEEDPSSFDGGVAEAYWLAVVAHILRSRRGPIRACSICVDFFDQFSDEFDAICRFLCTGRCNNSVEELKLWNLWNDFYRVPRPVFSCLPLTKLELSRCRLVTPEKFRGLPNLRALRLSGVIVAGGDFQRLVAGCERLESLVLQDVIKIKSVRVLSDTLSSFQVHTYRPLRFSFMGGAPRLEHVDVAYHFGAQRVFRTCHDLEDSGVTDNDDLDGIYDSKVEGSNLCSLFLRLHGVRCLKLSFDDKFAECLYKENWRWFGGLPPGHSMVNLKKLVMDMNLACEKLVSILSFLLNSCPNLLELAIQDDRHRRCSTLRDEGYWEHQNSKECAVNRLVAVRVFEVNLEHEHWIGLVKYLLVNAHVLKRMTIFYTEDSGGHSMATKEKLLMLRWASPDATLELKPHGRGVSLW